MNHDARGEFKESLKATKAHLEATRAQFEEANAKIEKRAGRNLFFAIGSGLIFGAVFMLSLFLKPLFALLVTVLVVIASLELVSAYRQAGRRVPRVGILVSLATVLLGAYFYGPRGLLAGFVVGLVVLTIWRLVEGFIPKFEVPAKTLTRDVFSGLFTLLYVGFLGSIAILLIHGTKGEFWVFTLVATVVSVDVGAYVSGLNFGKHKMTPRISPNKTWEGFVGAVIFGSAVALASSIFLLKQPWYIGIIIGVMVVLTATVGDLTESLIKRNLGVKDMSSWMPGHGGFLDRLDSLLPSTVPVYLVALSVGVV